MAINDQLNLHVIDMKFFNHMINLNCCVFLYVTKIYLLGSV